MDIQNKLQAVLDIGIALSAEKDSFVLFDMIVGKNMEITNCDSGTLYICNDEKLEFHITNTLSMEVDRTGLIGKVDFSPIPMTDQNVCAYAAHHRLALNIPDIYKNSEFDFSWAKNYDRATGYNTKSMLVVPLVDVNKNTMGVLQLINAMDDDGNIIPFDDSFNDIIFSLASQTAIAISNMKYERELQSQMWSFTEAMAAAIDELTPYNANHTKKVAQYCGKIADHINLLHEQGKESEYFSPERKEQLIMGAWLHDVGKLVIPLDVMNKISRLQGRERDIENRLRIISLDVRVRFLEKSVSADYYEDVISKTNEALDLLRLVDNAEPLSKEIKDRLENILDIVYEGEDDVIPFFTQDEKECMTIEAGTLTPGEREIMESHVVFTKKILDKVYFDSYFKDSSKWAYEHHEFLDGTGYPRHLTAEDLELETRIMTVADICDALMATDRPYKKSLPKEQVFDIMRKMAGDGKIDSRIVEYLYDCIDI